jgi:hypothetical protein
LRAFCIFLVASAPACMCACFHPCISFLVSTVSCGVSSQHEQLWNFVLIPLCSERALCKASSLCRSADSSGTAASACCAAQHMRSTRPWAAELRCGAGVLRIC